MALCLSSVHRPPQNSPPKYLLVTRPCTLLLSIIWSILYFILSSAFALLPLPSSYFQSLGDAKRVRPRPAYRRTGRAPLTVVTALSTSLPSATLSPALITSRGVTRRATSGLGTETPSPRRSARKGSWTTLIGSFEPHSLDDVLESDEEDVEQPVNQHRYSGNYALSRHLSGDEYHSDLGSMGHLTPDHGSEESEHSEAETLVDSFESSNHASVTSGKAAKGLFKACPRIEARRARKADKLKRSQSPESPTSPTSTSPTSFKKSKSRKTQRGSSPVPQRPPITTFNSAPAADTVSALRLQDQRPSFSRSSSDSSTLVPDGHLEPRSQTQAKRSTSWLAILRPFRSRSPLSRSPSPGPVLASLESGRDTSDVLPAEATLAGTSLSSPSMVEIAPQMMGPDPRPVLDSTGQTRLVMAHLVQPHMTGAVTA